MTKINANVTYWTWNEKEECYCDKAIKKISANSVTEISNIINNIAQDIVDNTDLCYPIHNIEMWITNEDDDKFFLDNISCDIDGELCYNTIVNAIAYLLQRDEKSKGIIVAY